MPTNIVYLFAVLNVFFLFL